MRLVIAIVAATLIGCTSVVGKIDWEETPVGTVKGTCQGLVWSVGQHDTGCTQGGPISIPGATLIGGIFSGLADVGRSFFGGGSTTNINVRGAATVDPEQPPRPMPE